MNNKVHTAFRERMNQSGTTMLALAQITRVSTALVCYIAQGYARFPTYEQLASACRFMCCKPTDIYAQSELRMMYPEQFPKKKRLKDGNPRVRIDGRVIQYIRSKGLDVNMVVNQGLLAHLYAHGVKYTDIFGGENDTTGT